MFEVPGMKAKASQSEEQGPTGDNCQALSQTAESAEERNIIEVMSPIPLWSLLLPEQKWSEKHLLKKPWGKNKVGLKGVGQMGPSSAREEREGGLGNVSNHGCAQEAFERNWWGSQIWALCSGAQQENEQQWTSCGTREVQAGYMYILLIQHKLFMWGQSNSGTGAPLWRLCSLGLWRILSPNQTKHWTNWSHLRADLALGRKLDLKTS